MRVDGGLVANEFVCQFLADMLSVTIELPKVTETTAWGAAVLAGVQVGLFGEVQEVADTWQAEKSYYPQMPEPERQRLYMGWKQAIDMLVTSDKE